MMHRTTRQLMIPIIETYAIGFELLADLISDLLNDLISLMIHIVVMIALPVYFLAITFYTIVMTLLGVAPQQDFPHHPVTPNHISPTPSSVEPDNASNEGNSNPKHYLIGQVGGWLKKLPDGRVKSASVGHLRINTPPTSADSLSPPPAIPPHLKNCEYYYHDLDEELLDKSVTINDGGQPIVRITVDGVSQLLFPESATTFLQSLESIELGTVNDDGVLELSQGKRGKLEMRHRVYVGPVQWLLRVLREEV